MEDGIIDNPPSCSARRTPINLPFPLYNCRLTSIRHLSRLPTHRNVCKPQRQFYCKASLNKDEAKEKDHIHYSVNVPIEQELVSHDHNYKSRCDCDVWIKKVNFFRLNPSQTNIHQGIRRENYYLWTRLPTFLGVNPILSLLCVRLFGNVGSVSVHPLGLLPQRPILVGTRS